MLSSVEQTAKFLTLAWSSWHTMRAHRWLCGSSGSFCSQNSTGFAAPLVYSDLGVNEDALKDKKPHIMYTNCSNFKEVQTFLEVQASLQHDDWAIARCPWLTWPGTAVLYEHHKESDRKEGKWRGPLHLFKHFYNARTDINTVDPASAAFSAQRVLPEQ